MKPSSTTSPNGASTVSMAAIPDSLMSMLRPISLPHVRELIVTSTSSLNRGRWRESGTVQRAFAVDGFLAVTLPTFAAQRFGATQSGPTNGIPFTTPYNAALFMPHSYESDSAWRVQDKSGVTNGPRSPLGSGIAIPLLINERPYTLAAIET